eukprot:s2757_g7.t1
MPLSLEHGGSPSRCEVLCPCFSMTIAVALGVVGFINWEQGATFTSKWCSFANDLADPDLWKRTVAHQALQRLFMEAHQKIEDLQKSFADLDVEDVGRDLVAADLQVIALEELMKQSPSPEREDVPLCEERRTWSGRTARGKGDDEVKGRTKKALPPAPPLGPMPNGSFRSTVDSWNRERDQWRIEKKLGLPEEGDDTTVFVNEKDASAVIAVGYRRVLYGDHGPYVEFTKHQIHWEAFPVVLPNKPSHAYYDERFTQDNHVKAYEQRKTVRDKANPPPGEWSANNDRYDTGYADYQPGYIYISADCVRVKDVPNRPLRPRPPASSVLKAKAKVKPRPPQSSVKKMRKAKKPPMKPVKPTKPTQSLQVKPTKFLWSQLRFQSAPKPSIRRKDAEMQPTFEKWKMGNKGNKEHIQALNRTNPVINSRSISKCVQKPCTSRGAKRKRSANAQEPKGFWIWVE